MKIILIYLSDTSGYDYSLARNQRSIESNVLNILSIHRPACSFNFHLDFKSKFFIYLLFDDLKKIFFFFSINILFFYCHRIEIKC